MSRQIRRVSLFWQLVGCCSVVATQKYTPQPNSIHFWPNILFYLPILHYLFQRHQSGLKITISALAFTKSFWKRASTSNTIAKIILFKKYPAYRRPRISRPMRIVATIPKKSWIRETQNLLTDADSKTNILVLSADYWFKSYGNLV